jgi:hypothetical protein
VFGGGKGGSYFLQSFLGPRTKRMLAFTELIIYESYFLER